MLWVALTNSQNLLISGVTLILGTLMLRLFIVLRKKNGKQNPYDRAREEMTAPKNSAAIVGGTEQVMASYLSTKSKAGPSDSPVTKIMAKNEATISRQRLAEQLDVELLTLSRQIKAEIDTKIVALQLMIADADRVLQKLECHVSVAQNNTRDNTHDNAAESLPPPRHRESDRVRILRLEETVIEPPNAKIKPLQPIAELPAVAETGDLTQLDNLDNIAIDNIVIEDPFAENDFGFNRAMLELDRLSSSFPGFDSAGAFANHEPSYEISPDVPPADADDLMSASTPVSYPIDDYRGDDHRVDAAESHPKIDAFPEPSGKNARRRTGYTNRLLTQSPPQIDSLMTNDVVRKMGSKPRPATGGSQSDSQNAEALPPPVILKTSPPSAKTILAESAPYARAETELERIAVRKAKRHQLQYLIEKGMSPKEIAAHLEMPVGEVELIFSLHKRLARESDNATKEPRVDLPAVAKRIIPAEEVRVETEVPDATVDGEQVA